MTWQPSQLQPWADRPWPMEQRALAALALHGMGAEGMMPPAAGPRLATKVRGSVAVVPLEGAVWPWKADAVAEAVTMAAADTSVGAIVLAIDSPGGVITGVPEAADAIAGVRGSKPIYAVATGMMASAAYWIGAAADKVIISPSAYAGSIGVWTMHADLSKMLDEMGVKVTLIKAGEFKTEGNPFEPLSKEAQTSIQADVNDAYDAFVGAVARYRGVAASDVRNGYGQGRVLNAPRSKEAGLADKIGTLDQVVAQLVGPPKPAGRNATTARRRLDLMEA